MSVKTLTKNKHMKKIKTTTLSKSEIEKIDSSYVRGVDKWRRMYAGMASNIERYEKDIIYLKIENTEKQIPSNYETALGVAKSWIEFNKALCNVKGFVVSFYTTNKSTGFSISGKVVLENEELVKDLVGKMQVEEELTLSGIFSGLFSNKTT